MGEDHSPKRRQHPVTPFFRGLFERGRAISGGYPIPDREIVEPPILKHGREARPDHLRFGQRHFEHPRSERRSRRAFRQSHTQGLKLGPRAAEDGALVEHLGTGEVVGGERNTNRKRIRQVWEHHLGFWIEGVGALRQARSTLGGEGGGGREELDGGLGECLLSGRDVDNLLVEECPLFAQGDTEPARHLRGCSTEGRFEPAVLFGHLLGGLRRREVAL